MEKQLSRPIILIIALVQGLLLTLLYISADKLVWPSTDPRFMISLTSFSLLFPAMFLLTAESHNWRRALYYLLPFCLVVALMGVHTGWQYFPIGHFKNSPSMLIFVICLIVACFKALMYTQLLINNKEINFANLYKQSWKNFITVIECGLFVGIFWSILLLGAELFEQLGITVFSNLLRQEWFVIPCLTLAATFAITVFRNIAHTAENIASILQTLLKFLLPVISVISAGFALTLIFTGLDGLWQGSGSTLLLWLQVLTLFFFNAVYKGESHSSYNPKLHYLIVISIILLPLYSVIASYGLWLRIDQYGLTMSRFWGCLILVITTVFSLAYALSIVLRSNHWLTLVARINVVMGLVILALVCLLNTPLLNPQSIVVNNQFERLKNNKVSIDDFDFNAIQRHLGRQGYLAVQENKSQLIADHPRLAAKLEHMYDLEQELKVLTRAEFAQNIHFLSKQEIFPAELINELYRKYQDNDYPFDREKTLYLSAIELNNTQGLEYVCLTDNGQTISAYIWLYKDSNWTFQWMNGAISNKNVELREHLHKANITTRPTRWKQLVIGDNIFTVERMD